MAADGLYFGFDVGTQGLKGVCVDGATGDVVARAAAGYGLLPGLEAGAAEQDPETWIEALARVARTLAEQVDRTRVRGVGVSGQQHGLVALDAGGRPVRPAKLW